MKLREAVECNVLTFGGDPVTDELFQMAAHETDNDIRQNHIVFGARTSFDYVVYVMVTTIMILQKISKSHKQCAY